MKITKIKVRHISTILQGIGGMTKEGLLFDVSYWLIRDMDFLTSEGRRCEKKRMEIVLKYVKKDKDGKPILKNEGKAYDIENEKEFNREINELLETEVDIKLKTFKLNDFKKAYISMENLVKIKPIIEDWEKESKAILDLGIKKKVNNKEGE